MAGAFVLRLPKIAGPVAFLIGSVGIAAGLAGITETQVIHPRMGRMAPVSAVCFALLGAALWLLRTEGVSRLSRAVSMTCAAAALVLAATSIAGLTRVMPLFPAVSFALLALAILSLDRKDAFAQVLTSASGCITIFALVSYGYGSLSTVTAPPVRPIAVHSLVLFALLGVGIAFARPGRGFIGLALEASPGGRMIRVLVPVAVAVPGALGWIILEGERAGRYPSTLALAIFAISTTILFGILSWWTGWWIDRTEERRRRAERALEKSELSLGLLIDGVRDHALLMLGPDGIVTAWNKGAERIMGYSARDIVGKSFSTFYAPEDVLAGLPQRALGTARTEGKFEYEGWHVRADGSRFVAAVSMNPTWDAGGGFAGFSHITRDITGRRRLEDQMRGSQKLEALGRLAGGIAHDFNNMLTVIFGYCELLASELPEQGDAREKVDVMKEAAARAARLTSQLLAFSRRQAIQPRAIDLNVVVTSLDTMLERFVGEDVGISVKLDPDLKVILADHGQLEQVLINLVVNARDAMPTGGHLLLETRNFEIDQDYARTHVGTTAGPNVMLAVSDTGIGMTPDVQARIFEPFFTTKVQGKGTGLGLATVYGIVKQFGGHIWVHSEAGKGTTFKVSFPAVEVEAAPPAEAKPRPVEVRGTETVLLVEDDAEIRKLAARILERHGYRTLSAGDAEEANLRCAAHPGSIDILVTDVVMPATSGPELAAQLASRYPGLRVLYTSGYTADAMERIGLVETRVAFLQKPYTPDTLISAIRRELASPASGA